MSNYIHSRKLVVSRPERLIWEKDRDYYLNLGYGLEQAEARAWDHYYAARKVTT